MGKSKREFTTEILRLRKETLDPKTAKGWLKNGFPCLLQALEEGFSAEDAETRSGFRMVFGDVMRLHDACVAAIETGKPVRVTRIVGPGDIDWPSHTQDLARVVTQRCFTDDIEADFGLGFEMLAEMLNDRLKEKAPRAVAADAG